MCVVRRGGGWGSGSTTTRPSRASRTLTTRSSSWFCASSRSTCRSCSSVWWSSRPADSTPWLYSPGEVIVTLFCGDLRLCPARCHVLHTLLGLHHTVEVGAGCLQVVRAALLCCLLEVSTLSDVAGGSRRPEKSFTLCFFIWLLWKISAVMYVAFVYLIDLIYWKQQFIDFKVITTKLSLLIGWRYFRYYQKN